MIVKSQSASKRPQRYEPCIIYDADMELEKDDLKGFAKPPKIPSRVVMNNATISIFMSDNFGDIQFSSVLSEV